LQLQNRNWKIRYPWRQIPCATCNS